MLSSHQNNQSPLRNSTIERSIARAIENEVLNREPEYIAEYKRQIKNRGNVMVHRSRKTGKIVWEKSATNQKQPKPILPFKDEYKKQVRRKTKVIVHRNGRTGKIIRREPAGINPINKAFLRELAMNQERINSPRSNTDNNRSVISNNNRNIPLSSFPRVVFDSEGWQLKRWIKKRMKMGEKEYMNTIQPKILNLDKKYGIKQDNIKQALHYHGKPNTGHYTRWNGLKTSAHRNTAPYTKEKVHHVLNTLLRLGKKRQNIQNDKKKKTRFHIHKEPKQTPTSPRGFTQHMQTYRSHNIRNNLSIPLNNLVGGRYIPTTKEEFDDYVKSVGRSNTSNVKINTSNFPIPTDVFRHGTKKMEIVYAKILSQVEKILTDQHVPLTDIKRFLQDFIHRQVVDILPKDLTGQMTEVVITDIEDLCNFLYMQKRDMEHDFTGDRLKKALQKEAKIKNININISQIENNTTIKDFVSEKNMKTYMGYIKPTIESINKGSSSLIDTMFSQLDGYINTCFLHTLKGTEDEAKFFEKILNKYRGDVHTKDYEVDKIPGHLEIPAVFDMDSKEGQVKYIQDVFKKYTDLAGLCDAGSGFKEGFYDTIVARFKEYRNIISKITTTSDRYITYHIVRKIDPEFAKTFRTFYTDRVEGAFKLLDSKYVADKFVEFVLKKSKTIETDTIEKVLKRFMSTDTNENRIYTEFIRHMNASTYLFDFSSVGVRVYYKPNLSSKDVVLVNDAALTVNQYKNDILGASIINGQSTLPIGTSLGNVGK